MTTVICRIQYKSGAGNEGHITGPGGPLRLRSGKLFSRVHDCSQPTRGLFKSFTFLRVCVGRLVHGFNHATGRTRVGVTERQGRGYV